jgi:hypothetical protein
VVTRVVASVTVVVVVLVDIAFGRVVGFGDLGTGPLVALVGAALVGLAAWWPTAA